MLLNDLYIIFDSLKNSPLRNYIFVSIMSLPRTFQRKSIETAYNKHIKPGAI